MGEQEKLCQETENEKNPYGLTREIILEAMSETKKAMQSFKRDYLDKYDVNMGNKLKSELVGKIFEAKAQDVFSDRLECTVIKEKNDQEPDLFFKELNKPLEIKVTSTNNAWTGGEFSKRPFDYLLVSWGGNFDEFFVALTHLEKNEWDSNISKNYYGPSFKTKKLCNKKDKIIFLGRLKKTPRGAVYLVREKV